MENKIYLVDRKKSSFLNKDKKTERCQKEISRYEHIVTVLLSFLVFFIPWIFSSYTEERFEINKNIFLIVLISLATFFWVIKIRKQEKIVIKNNIFNLPVLTFLGFQLICALLSEHKTTSLWGYRSSMTGGLFSTFVLILLYFLVSNNTNSKKQINILIKTFIITINCLAFFTILKSFGIFTSVFASISTNQPSLVFIENSVFTPLGNQTLLPIIFSTGAILTIKLASSNKHTIFRLILSISSFLIQITAAFLTANEISSVLTFILLSAIFMFSIFSFFTFRKKVVKIKTFVLSIVVLLFGITLLFPTHKTFKSTFQFSTESYTSFETAWNITYKTLKRSGIRSLSFGTGQATYPYNFQRYRPEKQNYTENWQETLLTPNSYLLNLLATTGVLGCLSILLLMALSIYKTIKNKNNKQVFCFLFVSSFLLFTSLFSSLNIVLLTFLFITLGVSSTFISKTSTTIRINPSKTKLLSEIFFSAILLLILVFNFFVIQNYISEVHYNKSLIKTSSGDFNLAKKHISKAISYNATKEYFYIQKANVSVGALIKNADTEKAENNTETTNSLLKTALRLNPQSPQTWESVSIVYTRLVELSDGQNFGNEAIETTKKAIELSPNMPTNYIRLGQLYQYHESRQLKHKALDLYQKAYDLKENYPDAVVALGNYYEYIGEYEEAGDLYKYSLEKYNFSNTTNAYLKNKLKILNTKNH